jgi:hypothetical protein
MMQSLTVEATSLHTKYAGPCMSITAAGVDKMTVEHVELVSDLAGDGGIHGA